MPELQPGDPRRLGSYEIVDRLGEGGQGVVYGGVDASGNRAAIKLLRADLAGDTMARNRFVREAQAAKQVARFCTAQVLEADVAGDQPYIASEYVPGPSLYKQVTETGPISGAPLDRLAIGTATAMVAIHQAGIVHRDFKPHNVIMAPDGPRVIDFGIARALDTGQTNATKAIGTPSYMAPEQVAGATLTEAVDVWAWATTIVFAATGHPVRRRHRRRGDQPGDARAAVAGRRAPRPAPADRGLPGQGTGAAAHRAADHDGADRQRPGRRRADPHGRPGPGHHDAGGGVDARRGRSRRRRDDGGRHPAGPRRASRRAPRLHRDPPAAGPQTGAYRARYDNWEPERKSKAPIFGAVAAIAVLALVVGLFMAAKGGGDGSSNDPATPVVTDSGTVSETPTTEEPEAPAPTRTRTHRNTPPPQTSRPTQEQPTTETPTDTPTTETPSTTPSSPGGGGTGGGGTGGGTGGGGNGGGGDGGTGAGGTGTGG
ncbi:serine/threonine-protein kinase [Actinomadura luteofluorescens]|uniref:serine/threonine-protein kinase n=1 Tax=Actinomadura luteofluorescens TaxID=46163 RepID=UPI00362DD11A